MNGFYPEGKIYETQENKRSLSSVAALGDAIVCETVLEAPVIMCDTDHNLIVDLGCMKGVIPRSEGAIGIDDGSTRDIALISRVGRTVCFVVTEFKTDKNGEMYAVCDPDIEKAKIYSSLKRAENAAESLLNKVTNYIFEVKEMVGDE